MTWNSDIPCNTTTTTTTTTATTTTTDLPPGCDLDQVTPGVGWPSARQLRVTVLPCLPRSEPGPVLSSRRGDTERTRSLVMSWIPSRVFYSVSVRRTQFEYSKILLCCRTKSELFNIWTGMFVIKSNPDTQLVLSPVSREEISLLSRVQTGVKTVLSSDSGY